MNIIIEDCLSLASPRGIGQCTKRIYEILSVQPEYNVILRRKYFLENIKNSVIRRVLYILWLNTVFAFSLLKYGKNTTVLSVASLLPMIKFPWIRYYCILNDIRNIKYPELSTKVQRLHCAFADWVATTFSDRLITISHSVKNEIEEHYKKDNIAIIYPTVSIKDVKDDENNIIVKKLSLENKRYLFFVGGLDKNKNVTCIIDAFEKLYKDYDDLYLVIAGQVGNTKLVTNNERVIFTGFVPDEDIKVLYKNAYMYLFPSLYEGFGIPIVDAQYMGCPVICSDIPVFHEVGADSVLFAKPEADDFAKQIIKLLEDSELKRQLIQNGYENIKRFSKEVILSQLKEILE